MVLHMVLSNFRSNSHSLVVKTLFMYSTGTTFSTWFRISTLCELLQVTCTAVSGLLCECVCVCVCVVCVRVCRTSVKNNLFSRIKFFGFYPGIYQLFQ